MSNYKKTRGPTWKLINSPKCVPNAEHRKGNEELRKLLKKYGYKVWDHCNLLEEGYQITARKPIPEFATHRNPYMFFRWVWMEECTHYWRATLTASYDYSPENHYMHPWGFFEIWDITKTHIHLLLRMENRVKIALQSQTVIVDQTDIINKDFH